MKKIISIIIASSCIASYASYEVRIGVPDVNFVSESKDQTIWTETEPTYTEWVNANEPLCSSWTPDTNAYAENEPFEQTGINCTVTQTRNKQNREISSTGEYRNYGNPTIENQTIEIEDQIRNAVGSGDYYSVNTNTYTGKAIFNGAYTIGTYQRESNSTGSIIRNSNGNRVMLYFYKGSDGLNCEFRWTAGVDTGWTSKTPVLQEYIDWVTKYNYAYFYNSNGGLIGKYKYYKIFNANEGTYERSATIPCGVVNSVYSNITYVSKIELKAK